VRTARPLSPDLFVPGLHAAPMDMLTMCPAGILRSAAAETRLHIAVIGYAALFFR